MSAHGASPKSNRMDAQGCDTRPPRYRRGGSYFLPSPPTPLPPCGSLYQSPSQSSKKQQLMTPSLRFPLHAGGTEPVRGSPREAGGTSRRGAIVNSDRAIGITIECSASSRALARSSILVSNKIESIFIDCLTPNSVQRHRNSTNCPQPSLQPAFLFFRRQRFVVLHLYEHLHLSTFGYFERLFQPQCLICVAGAHGLYFHHLTHRVVYPIQARRGEVSLTYCC